MGEIRVNIPKDMEAAFEEVFPGKDKAAAVLGVIRAEIARQRGVEPEAAFEDAVETARRVRTEAPYFNDDDIRKAREELRK